ncbi:MAG TPA: XdhC family protein [Chloroflexia bacterium]|nr:XdhC family protein [Chloroflexia bacterium]
MSGAYSLLAELITHNKPAALATAISGGVIGAKLVVSGGNSVGSIHPTIDAQVVAGALELLNAERNETRSYELQGEQVEVFIEVFPPPQHLFIVGAVHVAIPLHRIAKMLGYHVTVIDARGALASKERFPLADAIVVEWPDDALSAASLDRGASVVVLTHDPKFDIPALLVAVQSGARYVGAIGSRTTNAERRRALSEQGVSDEQIARIYAPVGLDIGARTPSEIALAIMSEIVAVRYNRAGEHMRSRGMAGTG